MNKIDHILVPLAILVVLCLLGPRSCRADSVGINGVLCDVNEGADLSVKFKFMSNKVPVTPDSVTYRVHDTVTATELLTATVAVPTSPILNLQIPGVIQISNGTINPEAHHITLVWTRGSATGTEQVPFTMCLLDNVP